MSQRPNPFELARMVDHAEAECDALKAQRDEMHAAATAAHDRESALQDQLADVRARIEKLEGLCEDAEPFLGSFAMSLEHERNWRERYQAVLRSDWEKQT